jgi:autotransporter-associated beta strand protein
MKCKSFRLFGCLFVYVFALSATHAGSANWNLNPVNGDWNTASNWSPTTVPNASTDIATFHSSDTTNLEMSAPEQLDSLIFAADAPSYIITVEEGIPLTFWGRGVINESGNLQNITLPSVPPFMTIGIQFRNNSTAGELVNYDLVEGYLNFFETASAGSANVTITGGDDGSQTDVEFFDNSTAGTAKFIIGRNALAIFTKGTTAASATFTAIDGGATLLDEGTAANGTFISEGSSAADLAGGVTNLTYRASAGHGVFIANGGTANGAAGGTIIIAGTSTGSQGTFTINGGAVAGAGGGEMMLYDDATAAAAFITVNGGAHGNAGGALFFRGGSKGDTARLAVFGNGMMDESFHNLPRASAGSLEGEGSVFLGSLNLSVGGNNLSTTFSGLIQDGGMNGGSGGSLTKVGSGTLTLSRANTYTGGTSVSAGSLIISNKSGSGAGTGAVSVSAGTLGGSGTIAGAVTVGTGSGAGAFLAPAGGTKKPVTLTIQSALTLKADSTYTYTLKAKKHKSQSDQVIAKGVTIETGAQFNFTGQVQGKLRQGTSFSVISNTGSIPYSGTFANLPDGAILSVSGNNLQASYSGGDGNDLTLTVVE